LEIIQFALSQLVSHATEGLASFKQKENYDDENEDKVDDNDDENDNPTPATHKLILSKCKNGLKMYMFLLHWFISLCKKGPSNAVNAPKVKVVIVILII
jgi:hypothetical protein